MPDEPHAQRVQAGPSPFSFGLQKVQGEDGSTIVVFQLQTLLGETTVFMPQEFAAEMGRQLMAAGTGLTLAKPHDIKPMKRTNG